MDNLNDDQRTLLGLVLVALAGFLLGRALSLDEHDNRHSRVHARQQATLDRQLTQQWQQIELADKLLKLQAPPDRQ